MAHIALQATLSPAGSLAISIIRGAAAGFVGGLVGQLRGGSFRSGFVGSVAGGLAHGVGSAVSSTLVAAVFGGLAAEASGGSFSDGALSAAMVHLFNDEVKFFDGANGWVIKDHMDSGVPGVVTGYIQHKINNQWMENQRSYGSGSKERWQWWEPLPVRMMRL
ncbi:MAG: hypothetical protein HZT40_12090 [Candidatus Thiothrix singaporensis]|uniref:Uncharacterized protein n=1 Tax=Candidatus Thiothrix singaporensis TaxID=2799669 RepID=A0A7L6ASU5_9GAMM|nr:MAG: hypothetical protein HZT40_12090 [Candidatus Thiothrix singaporensis]